MAEIKVPMKGWKTKLGAALTAAATALGGLALAFPIPEGKPWVIFVAGLVGAAGVFFTVFGIGHKVEKAQEAVVAAQPIKIKRIPYYVQRVPQEELALLEIKRNKIRDEKSEVVYDPVISNR